MFEYVATILTHFSKETRSDQVYSIESFRIDVEDYVYIVETKGEEFILYETDYMFDIDEAIDVMNTIASENGYSFNNLVNPDTFGKDERILRLEGNSRIYLAASVNANEYRARLNPTTYGGSDLKNI